MQDGVPSTHKPLCYGCPKKTLHKRTCLQSPLPLTNLVSRLQSMGLLIWGNLKHLISRNNPRIVPDLKDSVAQHARNIFPNTLRSTVEHVILRFQLVTDNAGRHAKHILLQ